MNSNNPFDNFGIEHLSASSINTYIADPCMFIMRYLYKNKGIGNPAMWRGTVVDESIGEILTNNVDEKTAIKSAIKRFDGLYSHYKKEHEIDFNKFSKERSLLESYLNTAIPYFKGMGIPSSYQKEVRLQLDEIPIPIIGYIDLQFDGVVRDIKTTGRMPTTIPDSVNRQLSIYATVEQSDAYADYILATPKKTEIKSMQVENIDEHMKVVKDASLTIMNLLSYSNDINQIAKLFYPNFDSWMWSKDDIEFGKTIWS